MSRFSFLWARFGGDEAGLEAYSVPTEAVMADLSGTSVALIGNAKSLAQSLHGTAIDAADLVIRLNSAPMPQESSHGRRTDWLAISTPVDAATLRARAPRRILWMTRKRKRLSYALASRPGFYLNRLADVTRLRAALGGPPTTGLMMIDLLARSDAASVTLYGFDFFASLSLSGRRTAEQVPHDFAAERGYVEALIATDPRFRLV